MAPAVSALEALKPSLSPRNPAVPLLSNYDGKEVTEGSAAVESLIAQVSRPVRWDQCMETLVERGVTGVIELAPAGTLAGSPSAACPASRRLLSKPPRRISPRLSHSLLNWRGGRHEHSSTQQGCCQRECTHPGIGAYRPDVIVTNDDVCQWIDSSDEWIRQRTGIITRHRAAADVSVIDMAEGAAREALKQAGIEPSQLVPSSCPP